MKVTDDLSTGERVRLITSKAQWLMMMVEVVFGCALLALAVYAFATIGSGKEIQSNIVIGSFGCLGSIAIGVSCFIGYGIIRYGAIQLSSVELRYWDWMIFPCFNGHLSPI